jgi:hypothetical protein
VPTRLETLTKLGIGTFEHSKATNAKAIIEAVAAMIDYATAKPGQKPRVPRDKDTIAKLPFGPRAVFDALEQSCSDVIQMRPYDSLSFGRLGKAMCGIQGLEADDLVRVVSWINSGGLATWPNQVTWSHVCRHLPNWIAYARAWEQKGAQGQQMTPGGELWR